MARRTTNEGQFYRQAHKTQNPGGRNKEKLTSRESWYKENIEKDQEPESNNLDMNKKTIKHNKRKITKIKEVPEVIIN